MEALESKSKVPAPVRVPPFEGLLNNAKVTVAGWKFAVMVLEDITVTVVELALASVTLDPLHPEQV